MILRFTKSSLKRNFSKAEIRHVMLTSQRSLIGYSSEGYEKYSWVGRTRTRIELEIIAINFEEFLLVIHVMPTSYRRKERRNGAGLW